MSVHLDLNEHSPYGRVTQPVVSGRLWRGIGFALVPSLAAWYAVIRLVGWLAS